jgi:hypothetical protein
MHDCLTRDEWQKGQSTVDTPLPVLRVEPPIRGQTYLKRCIAGLVAASDVNSHVESTSEATTGKNSRDTMHFKGLPR